MLWKTWTFLLSLITILVSYRVYVVLNRDIPPEIEQPEVIRWLDEAGRIGDYLIWLCNQLGIEPATWPVKVVVNYGAKILFNGFGNTLTNITIRYTTIDKVPVAIFQPDTLPIDQKTYPTIVYIHGGGWTWFSVDVYAGFLSHLATRTNLQVVAIDYRLAPKYPFPAAYEDCLTATKGLLKRRKDFKVRRSRLVIAGDGSGGNLAAAVASSLKEKIFMQVLINPTLQMFDFETPSYQDNNNILSGLTSTYRNVYHWLSYSGISTDFLQVALQNDHIPSSMLNSALASYLDSKKYLPSYHEVTKRETKERTGSENLIVSSAFKNIAGNAQIAPMMAFNVEGVPNMYMVTSQYDVFRDEAIMYTHRLFAADIKVKLEHYKQSFHGFIMFSGYGPIKLNIAREAIDHLLTFNKEKKITQTVVLTEPVLTTSRQTLHQKIPKQTLHGAVIRDKNAPLYIRKINTWAWENAHHHHTKKFTLPKLGVIVARRGQPFKMTLTFNRPYDSLIDELRFYFETGDKPLPGNDTMICLSSYTSQGSSGWKSDFLPIVGTKNRDGMSANLWIFTPADCIVSDWKFSLQSILRTETDTATVTYEHPDRIYILFNPWCKNDVVYLPPEPMLDEYIMNSSGIMFTGCSKRVTVKPWIYGQFESGILEACLYIIKRGFNFRTSQSMGDPVAVTRSIAAILNGDDSSKGGVLKSLWSTNDYPDGRSPTMWSGSVSILKQYLERVIDSEGDNPEPIKYGHCFVYAGLVTTVCRAVGIPCRCVTSYNSGSGIDGRLTVDCYYEIKEDGIIEEINDLDDEDLIWNFHVWNDVWMKRIDLENPCNEPEWQALDATPNINGNGKLSCGPAPHYAVKNGLTEVNHDTGTIFAKINADIVQWLKLDMGEWTVFNVQFSRLGHSISSKTPDGRPAKLTYKYNLSELSRIRQDITSDYKYKKGTQQERDIVKRSPRKPRPMHHCKTKDVKFSLDDKEFEYFGDDFNVRANLSNLSDQERTVHVILQCESVHYNGKRHEIIKQRQWTITIPPHEDKQLVLGVYESDYLGKLTEHTCLRQVGYLNVQETEQIEATKLTFLLQKPHLDLKVEETVYKNTNFALKLFFKNPLHRSLSNCCVSVEGAGLESMMFIRQFRNVAAQCEWTGVVNLMPIRSKSIDLSATFHCKEMFDIIGFTTVSVENGPKEEPEAEVRRAEPVNSDISASMTIPDISVTTSHATILR